MKLTGASIFMALLTLLLTGETQAQTAIRVNSNQRLDKGQKIEVAGKGSLSMQTDGNLVLYDAANQPRWATGTNGKTVTHVIMQTDGNLVIFNNTTPVWASDTANVGASGGYFEIDLSAWTGTVRRADGAVAKVLFGQGQTVQLTQPTVHITQSPTVQITPGPTITQGPTIQGTGTAPLKFPRQQGWEQQVLSALGMQGVPAAYANMTPLQQAIGPMALDATEAYFQAKKLNLQPREAIDRLKAPYVSVASNPTRDGVIGLVDVLVMANLKKNQSDAQSVAVRQWADQIYRRMRVDAGIGTLKEYYVWKNNPCGYSAAGYQKPQECLLRNNPDIQMWKTSKPPSDLLGKAGMVYAAGNNNQIVQGVAGALGTIGWLGGLLTVSTTLGVNVAATAEVPVLTSLFDAFGGAGSLVAEASAAGAAAGSGGGAAAAGAGAGAALGEGAAAAGAGAGAAAGEGVAAGSGAIGAAGWGSVIAGPVAIIAAGVTIGVSQGIAVIEGEQAEWKLKQAISVAMKEATNMANVAADPNGGASMLLVGLVKSAQDGWRAPSLDIDGELTLFCEAGYVGKYYVTYTLDGQPKSFSTKNLSAGFWETMALPAKAKNIEVKGVMLAAGEREIFKKALERPTYAGFKIYGTIFKQDWSNDWPLSVGGEVSTTAAQVKLIHSAGYVAKWDVAYDVPGYPRQTWSSGNTTLGYNTTYTFPANATNINIKVQGATALLWEPWRTPYDKTYPTPPNFCLKIYGTTLDQKWNNECN
jgi:hypothetical protein